MKAKKLLAIFLATLMLLLAFPITAFADTAYIAEVTVSNPYDTANPTKVTQCATWADVITAATATNAYNVNGNYSVREDITVTVKLLVAEVSAATKLSCNCPLIIDGEYAPGQYATLNYTNTGTHWLMTNNNLTVKNLTFVGTYMIEAKSDADADRSGVEVLLNNVTVTNARLFNINNGNPIEITLDGCKVKTTNAIYLFYSNGAADKVLTLNDTVIDFGGTRTDNNFWDPTLINRADSAAFELNLTGSTTINYNPSIALTNGAAMFYGNNKSFALNIGSDTDDGSGVTLNLGAAAGETTNALSWPSFFRRFSSLEINDRGGNWVVNAAHSKESGKNGARFYFDQAVDGEIKNVDDVLALTQNGSFYDPFNCNLPAGTFKTIMSSETFVENHYGAQIRTVAPDGIRFQSDVNKTYYDLFGDNAVYGMKVTTDTLLGTGTFATAEGLTVAAESWKTEGETYLTLLTGFENTNYRTVYCVNSYMTLTYDTYNGMGGGTVTVWATYDAKANSRSIWQVAKAAAEDPNYVYSQAQQAYINNIVNSTAQ